MAKYLCKNFDLNSIVKCSFSLTESELKVFLEIAKKENLTVSHLSKKLTRDRSTIQKIIIKLLEKNIIIKKKKSLKEGGYKFYYSSISKTELKKNMLLNVEAWHSNVKKEIKQW